MGAQIPAFIDLNVVVNLKCVFIPRIVGVIHWKFIPLLPGLSAAVSGFPALAP